MLQVNADSAAAPSPPQRTVDIVDYDSICGKLIEGRILHLQSITAYKNGFLVFESNHKYYVHENLLAKDKIMLPLEYIPLGKFVGRKVTLYFGAFGQHTKT